MVDKAVLSGKGSLLAANWQEFVNKYLLSLSHLTVNAYLCPQT
jgi:hypothetical protein